MQVLEPFQPVIIEQAWGNLVLLVKSLRVGFFGYGYKLVAPTVRAEGVPLASLADIGLMKLDALAGRATRKDFHDLYAISRHVSLRDLLDLAPVKYPSVRDFEAMVLRYMVYFDRAEEEESPPLLQDVSWTTVKAFFRKQALALGRGWLA
jgi:hypothetical protein